MENTLFMAPVYRDYLNHPKPVSVGCPVSCIVSKKHCSGWRLNLLAMLPSETRSQNVSAIDENPEVPWGGWGPSRRGKGREVQSVPWRRNWSRQPANHSVLWPASPDDIADPWPGTKGDLEEIVMKVLQSIVPTLEMQGVEQGPICPSLRWYWLRGYNIYLSKLIELYTYNSAFHYI